MSAMPSLQIPDAPTVHARPALSSATPKTPKSMLKNLFAWKKTTVPQDNEVVLSPESLSDERPQTSTSIHQSQSITRKPSFSQRSRSDTNVPQRSRTRSKSRRRSRSRCRAVWDPPPLFQAYNQAFMHDMLQVPSKGFLDWLPRNASNRSSAKSPDSPDDDRDDVGSPAIGHRRSMSDSNASSLSKRLVFLFENGYILQYKADGSQDRLPERVLQLSRDSVAFASDAIPGQHWVLEICPHGRADSESKAASSKLSWSRMSLKAPDTKRLSEKLLLVFDSPNALFDWLFSIRKQIEGLGGLEYQPDAPPLPELPKRPTLRHASSEYFKRKNGVLSPSSSSSTLQSKIDGPSDHEKELPQLPAGLSYQQSVSNRSTATSSVATATSLEHFRESYSGSSTTGTALSSDVSAMSLSPTRENFAPTLVPVTVRDSKIRSATDRTIPRTPTSPLFKSEERSPSPEESETQEGTPPTLQQTEFNAGERPQDKGYNFSTQSQDVVEQEAGSSQRDERPVLEPVPLPELRKRMRQAQYKLSVQNVHENISSRSQDTSDESHHHMTRPSLGGSSKAPYGLFPKKLALNVQAEPLIVPEQDHVPGLLRNHATDHLEISDSPITPVASAFGASMFERLDMACKKPKPKALHLLRPLELEQPMRSPAVTDAMLDSNFGMGNSSASSEPATPVEIRVPDFSHIAVDKSLFQSVKDIESRSVSPSMSPKGKTLTPQRSMPNFHYGSSTVASAPVGPPPSGPLPAVPPSVEGQTSRSSTPNRRVSTQSSANRRASTKSISSKKAQSPPSSFSFPPMQPQAQKARSRSSSFKSPTTADTRTMPPTLARMPSLKPDRQTPTIGMVSIVSAPPLPPPPLPSTPAPGALKHKKSWSTSSAKSSRSRKLHTRTASGKTMYGSVANLPSLTNTVSPSCGPEPDLENAISGCFGMSASRSNT